MSIRAPDICDADELVARAAAMRDTLRERQAECEALGRLPDATNREYVDAGFFRVLQPRRFGGLELGLQAFLRVAVELSRGCPSSGWVYAPDRRPRAHRDHVARAGPGRAVRRRRLPLPVLQPPGQGGAGRRRLSRRRLVGLRLGLRHRHALHRRASPSPRRARRRPTRAGRRSRARPYAIVDNWDTLGMRGTGSRRVVVEDLFVPEHHTVAVAQPRRARSSSSRAATCTRTRSTAAGRSCRCSSPSPRRWPSASPRARSTTTSRCCRRAASTARRRRCGAS